MTKNFKLRDWILLATSVFAVVFIIIDAIYSSISYQSVAKPTEYQLLLGPGYPFLYFTFLSNIFLAAISVTFILKRNTKIVRTLFFNGMVYMTITFVIYWALVSWTTENTWNNAYNAFSSIMLHLVFWVNGVVIFVLYSKDFELTHKITILTFIPVAVYFFFALVLFFSSNPNVFIYSFLNFKKPLFINSSNVALLVFGNILLLILLFAIPIGFAYSWRAVINKINSKKVNN